MTWFVIFAATVFAVYFWRQHRAREREMNSPLASHRSGHSPIGQVVVLEQGIQNGAGRLRLDLRYLQVGFGLHFWLNILLTLLGYVPGIIHAIWVVLRK